MPTTYNSENLLDATGWHILKLLQENARIPFSELGRQVGLSAPAVTERVRKLEEAGIIAGYHAEVNPSRVGYAILAIIRMVLTGPNLARFTESVKHMHEVLECHRLTGSDSIYLKVMVPSINHLEAVINNLLQYGETTTTLVLSSTVNRRVIEHGPEEPLDAPVP